MSSDAGSSGTDKEKLRFSLVIPMHDEEENVDALLDELAEVLPYIGPFEVMLVDDQSRDKSLGRAQSWKARAKASWLRIICLGRQSGQSGAIMAGVEKSQAPLLAAMDGDLQNDPRDLRRMLELMDGEDIAGVTGIRQNRKDSFLRRVSSAIGNGVRNFVTGDRVTDSACGIKVFRRSWWLRVPRFAGMHRFMPTLVRYGGGKVLEIPVNHRPRVAGRAKYGIGNRALRGLRDCMAVRWYRSRLLDYCVEKEC